MSALLAQSFISGMEIPQRLFQQLLLCRMRVQSRKAGVNARIVEWLGVAVLDKREFFRALVSHDSIKAKLRE